MAYVATRAGQVFYEERGSGLPVVMLHATLHDHRDFDVIADRLSRRFHTIALDWPGHGKSETATADIDAMSLADVLEDIAETLNLQHAAYIGNSVGGYAAARLAIAHPERVAALVLVNGAGFAKLTTAGRMFCRLMGVPAINRRLLPLSVPGYMKASSDADRAIRDRVIARAQTSDCARTAATLWRSFVAPEYDLRDRAALIEAPVLLVWGSEDTILPLKAGRETHAVLPGSRLEVLETGHVVFASEPERFLDLVEPFIESAKRTITTVG
jgi:pimeloyl-ACP methyl ester carboxylesterase